MSRVEILLEKDVSLSSAPIGLAQRGEGFEFSPRQLHPENLSIMSDQVVGELSGHAALPAYHQRADEEASTPQIIKRLQVQKVDEGAPFPSGRSIPVLPRAPISWRRGVQL